MFKVAKIEDRVRYSAFKKTIKVMITPTNSLDDLQTQLNTYFEHLGENQYTRHLFGQMSCIDLGEDKDEYAWKMASYMPWLIKDYSNVGFMFRNMVKNNILYMYVRSICNCDESKIYHALNFLCMNHQNTVRGRLIDYGVFAQETL
ncbi:hypothetical protein MTR_1g016830 [Medicago truncatula]|uniref:Uncharacterized protein n=1 Tax=Medicago truncatula TaxID=3880 RepID=A0A072VP99_MEDTR|nr:hypothetical protein MTR_1g016830 [Medicago truncatula]